MSGDWGDDEGEVQLSVLRSTNFTDSGNLDTSEIAQRGFSSAQAAQIQVQPNDILLERSGGGPNQPVGRVVLIRDEMPKTGFANFVQTLRPNPDEIVPELLLWTLHQLNRSGFVEKLQHQTTQMRNLDMRDYLKALLPVPTYTDEQTRIAETLEAANDHVRAIEQQICRTERVKKALLQSLFVLGMSEIHSAAFAVRRGDFFVLRGNGNRDYVAIGGLLEEEPREGLVFSDLLIRVRFDGAKANPRFMKYLWQSPSFIRRLQSYAITGSGLWKIGQRSISRFEFALPDVDQQNEIADIFVAHENFAASLATQLTAARRVKQSLLQNLLTGKIRLKL